MEDFRENINAIKEIYPGHYRIILNFATTKILEHLLRDDYAFVWVIHHEPPQALDWTECTLPVFGPDKYLQVLNRRLSFDYLLRTEQFRLLLPQLATGIILVQLNQLPAYYVDINVMKGKTLYDILKKECEYLFYLELPKATDYGTLISSNRSFLQSFLDNENLDWADLP